jgi:phosphoserine aminotransferase
MSAPAFRPAPERPAVPNFSSGPCCKRPGYKPAVAYKDALVGRSHRSKPAKKRIGLACSLSREILGIPEDYVIGIVPASDTGAVEMAMWNMMGPLPVTSIYWDAFGKEWATDLKKQLKLPGTTYIKAPYGRFPDVSGVDWNTDVIFPWNGTTAGVKCPNADWIPDSRVGLSFCDATSACFSMDLPWNKLDVVTWSWQKAMGSEAAHGMLVLSPRAVKRLQTYMPPHGLPKIFRLRKGKKLNMKIFQSNPINTVSMVCIEDYIDALKWGKSIGGLPALIARSDASLGHIAKAVEKHDWLEFLADNPAYRSNTSVCVVIKDMTKKECLKLVAMLDAMNVAHDIKMYRDAPQNGLRIWCGCTVEPSDVALLMEWVAWAHDYMKGLIALPKVAILDGLAKKAQKALVAAGFEVHAKKIPQAEINKGALSDYDVVIVRSASKIKEDAITAALAKPGNRLRILARAGVGVDNIAVPFAKKVGIPVVNAPGAATRSVAELAIAHLLASARKICFADRQARAGKWAKKKCKGTELCGKNLGIVGFGRIGQLVGKLATGLGMNVHIFDPYVGSQNAGRKLGYTVCKTLPDLFKACTHISLHVGLNKYTKHMVNETLVNFMPGVSPDGVKCGNHIVSVARGGVVDEASVALAMKSGKLTTLALDVFEKEPLKDAAYPLFKFDRFHASPHVGAGTLEGQGRVGAEIVQAIAKAWGGKYDHVVNKGVKPYWELRARL